MSHTKTVLRWVLAAAMVAVGLSHFIAPDPFVRIVPPGIPPMAAVYASGVFEVLGGVGLVVPRTRVAAGWGLIALYVAVFPANIHMAVNHIQMGETPVSPALAWARLPFQIVFIAWAWWVSRPDARPAAI